jgi:hypothetical protein
MYSFPVFMGFGDSRGCAVPLCLQISCSASLQALQLSKPLRASFLPSTWNPWCPTLFTLLCGTNVCLLCFQPVYYSLFIFLALGRWFGCWCD